jgi:hypothetical protein
MWTYKGKEVRCHADLLEGCTDFVYMIHYTNGQRYIGKKCVRSVRKKPPLKGKKRNRRVMVNLPFLDYEGSHDSDAKLKIKEKEILYQCSTKKSSTYLESALLFHYDAIFDPAYLNKNIGGTLFDNSLDGLLEE